MTPLSLEMQRVVDYTEAHAPAHTAKAARAVQRGIAELELRLGNVEALHGDGEYCPICDHAWSCPTWRAAAGLEQEDESDEQEANKGERHG